MNKTTTIALTFSVALLSFCATATPKEILLQMRLRANDTETYAVWQSNLCAIAAHPGCCDEVWFSTGTGTPALDWHRQRATILASAANDLRRLGIVPSLQFQATLGHGDKMGSPESSAAKDWTGWTDAKGVETRYCNCPRQAKFHAYLAEVSRIYAHIGFHALWIDDDLRYNNHLPADNNGKHIGCWCATCLRAFNHENGSSHTREELARLVAADPAWAARWRAFSIASLCGVAQTIAAAFKAESPTTMMALQQGNWEDAADSVRAILSMLHTTSGNAVGYRPGAGAYYDVNPNDQIAKSLTSCIFRKTIGNPAYVSEWTPEIESWPRTYYSRSAQSVLMEGFSALMFGMNRISFFISDSAKETPTLYARHFWKPLADAAPVFHGYARAIAECTPVGISGPADATLRRMGIPVLAGIGMARGRYTTEDQKSQAEAMTSRDVQILREQIDARCGRLPALLATPFCGMMLPHVDAAGQLKTVALLNLRIDTQDDIRLTLRNLPPHATTAIWHELRRPNRSMPLVRNNHNATVTIPEIAALNAGYLDFK